MTCALLTTAAVLLTAVNPVNAGLIGVMFTGGLTNLWAGRSNERAVVGGDDGSLPAPSRRTRICHHEIVSAAFPTVALVPARPAGWLLWAPIVAALVPVIVLLFFVDDPRITLVWCVALGLFAFLLHVARGPVCLA